MKKKKQSQDKIVRVLGHDVQMYDQFKVVWFSTVMSPTDNRLGGLVVRRPPPQRLLCLLVA